MLRWVLRHPASRFLLVGAAVYGLLTLPQSPPPQSIAVPPSGGDVGLERLADAAWRLGLHVDDAVIAQRLQQNRQFLDPGGTLTLPASVDAALLQRDPVIRRRLAQRLRYVLEATADTSAPGRAELEGYLESPAHAASADLFVRLETFNLADGGGAPLDLGDGWLSRRTLAQQLGDDLAERVLALPIGDWSEPLPAPTGVYRVRLLERHQSSTDDLTREARAHRAVVERRRAEAVAAGLARLEGR